MTALHVDGLDGAIGSDADFEFNHAPEVHGLGEGWVSCRCFLDDLPASIGGFLGPGVSQSENESDSDEQGDLALPHRGLHIKKNRRNLGDNLKVTKVMALIRGLFRGKSYFDHFVGFASNGFPFPVENGFRSGLG
jgi:hypothetical protein